MISEYLKFADGHKRLLGFGFVLALISSFGQTYFIGIFGPSIQRSFGLSHTAWGTIYMLGTFASALAFLWTGKLIDRFDLKLYAGAVGVLLVIAATSMAFVSGPLTLIVAIFLLRHAGQSLASHVAITSMARYFEAGRGRAIALATLGFAVGEGLLPLAAVLAIAAVGWRWTYGGIAVLVLVGLFPALAWLLGGHEHRHRAYLTRHGESQRRELTNTRNWTRRRVLSDVRFRLLLPGIVAPAFILTAMFFHHLTLADSKGWSHEWITAGYSVYAATTVVASLVSGRLVDHLSAARLLPLVLLPLFAAMLVIGWLSSPWSAWLYLALAGVNGGMALTATSALWAELYGVGNLGAIRSMTTAITVVVSALGPISLGALMDLGLSIEAVCMGFAAYTALGALMITIALRDRDT